MRSPNYPQISLSEAIRRVREIYEAEATHPASVGALIQDLGYSGPTNGAARSVMGALNKYRLLTRVSAGEYKLSEIALDILLHDPGSVEREKAILEAALSPDLFKELHDEFGDTLPSENNLTARLVKRGFNPKSVGDVIKNYRNALELASDARRALKGLGAIAQTVKSQNAEMENEPILTNAQAVFQDKQAIEVVPPQASHPEISTTTLSFPVSPKNTVKVLFEGEITAKSVEALIKHLELFRETYFDQELE
jgi:hypothetical protein